MVVATAIFFLFLSVILSIVSYSTKVMFKGTSQSTLLQDSQVVGRSLTLDVQKSRADSFSVDPGGKGVSMLSAQGTDGIFHFDPLTAEPRWQAYRIYYFDDVGRTINLCEVSVVGFPQETAPTPIESFDTGSPLANYFVGGRPLARNVELATFSLDTDGLVVLNFQLLEPRGSSSEVQNFSIRAMFRN